MEKEKIFPTQLQRMAIEKAVESTPSPRVEAEKEVDTVTFSRVIEPENDAPHIILVNSGDNNPSVKVPRRTRATALNIIPDNTGIRTEIDHKVIQ